MHSRSYITVRYAETDKMGVAHHSNYPIWYEVGRTDYIKLFNVSYSQMEDAGVMIPLRNLNCHFSLPAKYEDKLIIRTWCINATAARIASMAITTSSSMSVKPFFITFRPLNRTPRR